MFPNSEASLRGLGNAPAPLEAVLKRWMRYGVGILLPGEGYDLYERLDQAPKNNVNIRTSLDEKKH